MVDRKVTRGISLTCDFCKKCFDSEISLINHNLNHSFDPYVCNICDETFYFETELSNHLKYHAKQKDFQEKDSICHNRTASTHAKCTKELINKNHVVEQQAVHFAEFSQLCNSSIENSVMDLNNKKFVNETSLIKSNEIKQTVECELPNSKQNFVCIICDECFADEQDLLNHSLDQHSDQPAYHCVVCSEKFSNKHELVKHGKTHLLEESDMCSLYDESFPKRGCVKIRHLFQSVDESSNQNIKHHLNSAKKSTSDEKGKTKSKILIKLNNEQEHFSDSEITASPNDGLNSNVKEANSFNSDPLESYCIAYNHETNEFEMFIDAGNGSKTNMSSQNLDLCKKNPTAKEVCSNSNLLNSIETGDVMQSVSDHCKNKNERSSIQNTISRTVESRKNCNVEKYLGAEDYNDISGLVAVVYNDDSNSVVTTYEVCELEVVDTCNKNSSLQSSKMCNLESVTVQKHSASLDVENAVASVTMGLCNDKSLESFNGHRAENTDSLNNHQDQTVNPMQGEIVLTDVTQIKEQTFLSDLFGGKFINENNVIKHISPCIKRKTDICHICKKAYSSKLALLRHIYIHSGEKPFSCNFCGKKYSRKYDLNDHLLNHTGQKPYACPVCSKGFIRKSHVDKHMLIHSDEKPYLCDVCGRSFSRKDYLIGHRLNHVDNNPFMCSTCDQTFSEREELDAHRAVHAVQVSYVCAVCKKRFTQKRHLERHFICIHTGEKPFSCDICNKQFARKDALYTHQKCHRKEKSLECSECGKSFSQKLNFLRHIRMHTSEKASHSKNKKKLSIQTLSLDNNVLIDNTSS